MCLFVGVRPYKGYWPFDGTTLLSHFRALQGDPRILRPSAQEPHKYSASESLRGTSTCLPGGGREGSSHLLPLSRLTPLRGVSRIVWSTAEPDV